MHEDSFVHNEEWNKNVYGVIANWIKF